MKHAGVVGQGLGDEPFDSVVVAWWANQSTRSPQILLAGHLRGDQPILVYRVADYQHALAALRAAGLTAIRELEIPHGPCVTFRLDGGQRYAIYELTRPDADQHFTGRFDE